MEKNVEKKVDELVIGGARITEKKGRLDFPSRLPFCPDGKCSTGCIFGKLWTYLKRNGRIGEEGTLAIGECIPSILTGFPSLYSPIDDYGEDYYEERILPFILMFYDEEFVKELWERIKEKVRI